MSKTDSPKPILALIEEYNDVIGKQFISRTRVVSAAYILDLSNKQSRLIKDFNKALEGADADLDDAVSNMLVASVDVLDPLCIGTDNFKAALTRYVQAYRAAKRAAVGVASMQEATA